VRALRRRARRAADVLSRLLQPALLWFVRAELPPAGLAVTEARITQSMDEQTPQGQLLKRLKFDVRG